MVLRTEAVLAPSPGAPREAPRSRVEPVAEDRWQWRIGMNAERKAKLDRLRYRARVRYGAEYVRRRIEEERRAREARRVTKASSGQGMLCEPVAPWCARLAADRAA